MNDNKLYNGLARTMGIVVLVLIGAVWLITDSYTLIGKVTVNGTMLILVYIVSIIAVLWVNNFKIVPFIFFLAYCFFSNAGQTLVELLHLPHSSDINIYVHYTDDLIAEMLAHQGAIIIFAVCGYLLFKGSSKGLESIKLETPEAKDADQIKLADILFIVICLSIFVVYLGELSKRAQMSYGDYYYESREGANTVLTYIYHVYGFTYLMTRTGWKKKMAVIIMAAIAVMAVFIGSRSNTIPVLVGFVAVSFLTQKKKVQIKFWHLLLGFLVLYIFSGFSELRNYSLNRIDMEVLKRIYGSSVIKSMVNILMEMGGSARTSLSTMSALDLGSIEEGHTMLYYFLKGFLPVQIIELFISAPDIPALSTWVTEFNGSESGWGFSIIGEMIYNFGAFSFLGGFIFGGIWVLCERLTAKYLSQKNYFLASAVLYLLGYAAFLARAEMALMSVKMRYTVYIIVISYLMKKFVFAKKEEGLK